MDVQQFADYEATLQFAMGDILRDLAILMRHAEQGQPGDETTYAQAFQHIKTFRESLAGLEQDLRAARRPESL